MGKNPSEANEHPRMNFFFFTVQISCQETGSDDREEKVPSY
jgi:hypothetical protein